MIITRATWRAKPINGGFSWRSSVVKCPPQLENMEDRGSTVLTILYVRMYLAHKGDSNRFVLLGSEGVSALTDRAMTNLVLQ